MSLTRLESAPRAKPARNANASGESRVPLADVLAALSRALDLAEGQLPGHTVRSCVIGMHLGASAGLDDSQLAELYHALLLKDLGCTANAARIAALFGADDQRLKARLRLVNWDDRRRLAREAWRLTKRGAPFVSRLGAFVSIARQDRLLRSLIAVRAERGAEIAERLGFPSGTVDGIRSLDEHWDGRGHPTGMQGEAIPIVARVMSIAQTTEMFLVRDGTTPATTMLRERRGRWFDPTLADHAIALLRDDQFCDALLRPEVEQHVLSLMPSAHAHTVDDDGLDLIAQAFAEVVDAKSPYTVGNSARVAHCARAVGVRLGFDAGTQRQLYRAGLLRDLGMLGVSSHIVEKAGPLTFTERAEIEQHPLHTWEVLRRAPGLSTFALLASEHHEKLDGTGYPWRRTEEELEAPARVLVVSDVFVAAMGNRAFREGLTAMDALSILDAQRGLRLDADIVDALAACVGAGEFGDGVAR